MVEPERVVMFRVPWVDDKGIVRVNRGYRIQMNSAIGPYKGGLRFDPTVNLGVLKFLAFEQVFKNSLTTLPMGGGKGGSDFNPKQSPHTPGKRCSDDVPAGDMNVGGREIGYLFGQYKRLANEWTGVLTGKGLSFGGSLIRPEATGYGDIYFAQNMLAMRGETFEGKKCVISGSGNVASFAAQKLMQLGATVMTLSDRSGAIFCESGITEKMLKDIMVLKNVKRGELADFAKKTKAVKFFPGANSWQIADKIDAAFPCARQNAAARSWARSQTCHPPQTRLRRSSRQRSCTRRARRRTPAAWPPRASRCRRTPSASAGRPRRLTRSLRAS